MGALDRWVFGRMEFSEHEEYDAFRTKFLIALMLSGAGFTALFIAGEYLRINRIDTPHFYAMHVFTAGSLLLWWALRGHPRRFRGIAWSFELLGMLEYTSSLWFVPQDELRLLWFFVNVPGVFLLLGHRVGWGVVVVTVAILLGSNPFMPVPYTPNALATAVLALVYLGVFFHVFGARSVSYFQRMRASNQQLQALASHDPLTGLLNARAFGAQCDQLVAAAGRSQQPYAVLFVDLDHFKKVNDQHGHAAGDAVLRSVAACLRSGVRRSDVLGRIGGEEFCLFLPDTTLAGALQLAESLRRAVEQLAPDIGQGQRLRVTASIGVSACEGVALPLAVLQQRADAAMYQAKALGRNRVSVLDAQGAPVAT